MVDYGEVVWCIFRFGFFYDCVDLVLVVVEGVGCYDVVVVGFVVWYVFYGNDVGVVGLVGIGYLFECIVVVVLDQVVG